MSESVALVTDSTAGIDALEPGGSWTIVPLELEIDGRRYREGPELSARDFHGMLQTSNTPPETLPPSVNTFVDVYRSLLDRHDRIVSIHISAELSDTVRNARSAIELIPATERIRLVDSRLAGPAVGLMGLEAKARVDAGQDAASVAEAMARIAAATRVYFSVFTLDYLYLGGRLERASTSSPARAEDRPILTIDRGRIELVERVVGETTRVARTLELTAEEFGSSEPLVVAVAHAGPRGEAAAQRLAASIESARPVRRCIRASLGPVLCAHTGFDVCGLAVYPVSLSALPG